MGAEPATGLWAYCVTRAGVAPADGMAGVDPSHRVASVTAGELALHVSAVGLDEYGAEPLRTNLNDFAWLERVARAHEAVLEQALQQTIVPLRLCTIFADEAAAQAMLAERAPELAASLEMLAGRDEWSVKVLADPAALVAAAAGEREEQPAAAAAGAGAAYLLGRRAEREDRAAAERLATAVADDVHARIARCADAAVVNAPQNRELSGHEGDMLLNGAYLVDRTRVDDLRALVAELGERDAGLGVRVILTGPFPPYNFSSGP